MIKGEMSDGRVSWQKSLNCFEYCLFKISIYITVSHPEDTHSLQTEWEVPVYKMKINEDEGNGWCGS